jgi:hypothetical protein
MLENSGPERARSEATITAVNRETTATVPVLFTLAGLSIQLISFPMVVRAVRNEL